MKPDCEHESGTHCIHSSERRAFRGCRRRWSWVFRQHYTPGTHAKPLEFGIAFHSAMEEVYEPSRWYETNDEEKLELAIAKFTEVNEDQRARFHKQNRGMKVPGDDYDDRLELGVGMLTHYVRNVHPAADRHIEPVMVEVPFSVPLSYPDGIRLPDGKSPGDTLVCEMSPYCGQEHDNPAPVTLNGRVDALFKDIETGGYYIIDWKSAAQLITDGEFLQLDDQITSYIAALWLILGLDIRGFLYAEIRKDFPRPPKKLERSYRGRSFSTDRRQPTTAELAEETFKEQDPGAYRSGLYTDYLDELRREPQKFHQRFPVIQAEAKLRNVMDNVAMEAMDMTNPDLRLFPAPSKMNCMGCAFKAPCLGKYNDEDYIYTLESLFGRK